jgi:serine/threonine protein kinase
MGEVYKARDTRLDRSVAIKIVSATLATDRQFRERFDREARAISQLTHPHICTLYDVGGEQGTAFLVMEYLEGETLADRLTKGALPLDDALQVAVQIADALSAAHRHGIVHRDLKPGNVMLTKAGAKLLDFGLAKARGPAVADTGQSMLPTTPAGLTVQGTILGTVQYMAPEQIEGKEADGRTDRRGARERLVWTLAGLTLVALSAILAATLLARHAPATAAEPVQFVIPPEKGSLIADFNAQAVSPDGRQIVFTASGAAGTPQLWIRRLDSLHATTLTGTDGAGQPFWSPDSQSVGFFAGGKLKTINVRRGPPQTLADAPFPLGGAWSRDGVILFGRAIGSPLFRVSAGGGARTNERHRLSRSAVLPAGWPPFLVRGVNGPGDRRCVRRSARLARRQAAPP